VKEEYMNNINDLIYALDSGDMATASTAFSSAMADKINDALNDKKIEIGQTMLGITQEEEFDEETLEDNNDDEVSGVSD
jgi:hypothetical protein